MSEVSRLSTDVQRALWPGDSGVFSFGYSSSTFFLLHFPPGSSAELLLKFLDLSLALSLQAFHPDLMCVQIHTRFSPWFLSTIHSVAWPIPSFSRFFFTQPFLPTPVFLGFPCGSAGKESACNMGDLGSTLGWEDSLEKGKAYPLQYSGLENSMDCIVHGVTKSRTWLRAFHVSCFADSQELFIFALAHCLAWPGRGRQTGWACLGITAAVWPASVWTPTGAWSPLLFQHSSYCHSSQKFTLVRVLAWWVPPIQAYLPSEFQEFFIITVYWRQFFFFWGLCHRLNNMCVCVSMRACHF